MNKARRNKLDEIVSEIQAALEKLEDVAAEEENAYDNMPESLQESERGEQMCEYIDTMDEAASCLDAVIADLQEIVDN